MAQIIPSTIKIGDRFHRPDKPNLVYRVLGMAAFYNHPPHVTLVSENQDQRTITIGTGVMHDRLQWVPAA